ncbi:MAG: rod shape-determining protein MreC [Candidatus Yanofskybacteria bacterium]|nr:rod shape-determining protein MreC [Candidatus Yanofskybacteria bacterium]
MKHSSVKFSVILLVAVIGAVFLNKYAVKRELVLRPSFLISWENYLFTKAENLGGLMGKIKRFNRLASENDKLKQDRELVFSLRAKIDILESENDFLRRANRIIQRINYPIVYAGIFNLNLSPAGYDVLLNKGSQDGISEGDVVVTAEGILVGKIQKVMQNFSRVLFISDPEFKITAKVLGSNVSGIARGALSEGMYLDFIVQEDKIKEEDILMSTGNDQFPPALTIGFVDHVEANATQMFKKVRSRPAVKDAKLNRVLVIKMQ